MTIDQAIDTAVQHQQAGRLREAESIYRQVLAAAPKHPVALHHLALIAITLRQFELAIDLLNQAVTTTPNDANTHNTLAAALMGAGRFDDSIAECRRALQLHPALANAHTNLANVMLAQGNIQGAIVEFKNALAIDAEHVLAHDGLRAAHLLLGDLQTGWQEFEWRWKKPDSDPQRFVEKQRWDGSDLHGKTIVLTVEQGFGDIFQFSRYAPLLAARGATVVIEALPAIHHLMSSLRGVERVVLAGRSCPPCDFVSPLLSVPSWYGISLETIPATIPYLTADPRLAASYRAKYFGSDRNLKVGLAWAGRPTHSNNHNRSMSLSALAAMGNVPGVTFYSLQKGDAAQQARTPPIGMKIIDLSTGLIDFNWTAGAIDGLDLVISVDTAVCHLTGALGKPVWVLLPFVPDWRWMLDREDSPWYPTMRLFRQSSVGDWAPVVQQVCNALHTMAESKRKLGD